jgi:hypothetical protein
VACRANAGFPMRTVLSLHVRQYWTESLFVGRIIFQKREIVIVWWSEFARPSTLRGQSDRSSGHLCNLQPEFQDRAAGRTLAAVRKISLTEFRVIAGLVCKTN